MHCWHYGGCTKGDHGSWSEYSCNMSLSLSWSLMVSGGLWFFFADLVHIQGEHVLRGSITLCPWCQRGRVIWCCCHQVQRGRLLALWCMCCTWWQPSHRRSSHLYTFRWIYKYQMWQSAWVTGQQKGIRWQFTSKLCHQVQRGRLLALWLKCCPWWQPIQVMDHYTGQ